MQQITLRDGATLAYRASGSGRPLVFVHGWGMGGACFQEQHRQLSADHRVVSFDLRGHGRSSPLAPGQGLQTLGGDLAEMLDALDLEGAVLVGWSLGAMVCWEALARAAGRVSGLVVVDMVPRLREAANAASLEKMRTDWGDYTTAFVPRMFAPGQGRPDLIESARAVAAGNDPESMACIWISMGAADYRPQLARIRTPTLIVSGEQSQLYRPAAAAALTAAIPNARKFVFTKSGHSPHLEEPQLFNHVIRVFAQGLSARDAPRSDPAAINQGESP